MIPIFVANLLHESQEKPATLSHVEKFSRIGHSSLNSTKRFGRNPQPAASPGSGVSCAHTNPKRQRGSLFLAAGELPYPSLTLRVSMPSPLRSGGDQREVSRIVISF